MTSDDELLADDSSTSGTRKAVLIQWAFKNLSGPFTIGARSSDRIVDVIDAMIASTAACVPISVNASRFASSVSGTASNMISAA